MEQISRRGFIGAGMALAATGATTVAARAGEIASDIDAAALHPSKATPLGLYLSPRAAHDALQADPEILFVDVRDPAEVTFVGHPAGIDKIIPLAIATHRVNPRSNQYNMATNPNVVQEFEALLAEKGKTKADPVFVTCRSGNRSAVAVRMLAEAGFTNVWSLTEGFEGDRNRDGRPALNGWRNAGLPWSYQLEPGVAWSY